MPAFMWFALLILGITLIPGLSGKIESTIQNIFGGVSKGTTGPVFTYWVVGSIIVTVIGIGAWIAVDSIAHKRGEKVAPPSLGQIGPGPAPSFHTEQALDLGPIRSGAGLGKGRSKVVEHPRARRSSA